MGFVRINFLLAFLLLCVFDGIISALPDSNLESIFEDNNEAYRQYQLLNSVVKRQTKGSCSCTCETKPVVRYTDDEKDFKHSAKHNKSAEGSRSGNHAATILRTGGLGSGSQHPLWSHGDHRDTPEVDGENQVREGLPERNFDSELNPDYGGNDWPNNQQAAVQSENRNSDIGWGHGSRFPWLRLPNEMCFRKPCTSNLDCCRKFNLCDKSASVCVDCWYGSTCTSEAQCCEKYPYCEILDHSGAQSTGRCVDVL